MAVPGEPRDRGLWTLPNAISLARLACVPWFLWLLLGAKAFVPAAVLLAFLGGSDWIDGYIARHFDQGSTIGKILDPTADRFLLVAAAAALLADGIVPAWVGIVVLAREVLVSVAALVLAARGARRIDVQWVGKAGTLALMFALPSFLLRAGIDQGTGHDVLSVTAWVFTLAGIALSYDAAFGYIPMAREALSAGRDARERDQVAA